MKIYLALIQSHQAKSLPGTMMILHLPVPLLFDPSLICNLDLIDNF